MEDFLNQIWNAVVEYVNIAYLLTFMFLAYLIKSQFQGVLLKIFKKQIKSVFIVLILATLIAIPYLLAGAEWQKVLFSYAVGTSLHELIFNWIEDKFKPKPPSNVSTT